MDLPIRFPSDAEVIAGELARFRALTPAEQTRSIGEMLYLYHRLADLATHPDAVARYAVAEEAQARSAIEGFVARHDRG